MLQLQLVNVQQQIVSIQCSQNESRAVGKLSQLIGSLSGSPD